MDSVIVSDFTEFINIIESGITNDVKTHFKSKYLEMEDEEGRRPIHYACQHGHVEIVKFLLEHNCNIEANDYNVMQPVHSECCDCEIKSTKMSPVQECNIDVSDKMGRRPLHYASEHGHVKVVKLLVKNHCNIDASNHNGMRPLHNACQNGHLKIVKLLLKHKCDIDATDNMGMRPLHLACNCGRTEIVKLLLEHKCDINVRNNKGVQPIQFACENGHIEIVKLLLQHQCNADDLYDDLKNRAVKCQSQELIDLLDAWRNNKSMCSIALAMSLECESGCSHKSCFTSLSVKSLKKQGILIGGGSFGNIYKCSLPIRTFAMKIIRTNDEANNIEKEIENYKNTLKHVNIVQYYGAIKESHQMTIFMEYVDGESLYARIKNCGSLSHNLIKKYSRQIVLGINYLHENKIIHRDIKPANFLLDSGSELLKLCDFGISRSLMTVSTIKTRNAETFCGTPNYLAPEVINSEPYGFPADIWSIGATLVEMLTGHPPFHLMNQMAVILKISQLQTLEFTSVQPMSYNLKSFVDQMLQGEPSKRATAKQLLECKFFNQEQNDCL